MPKNIKLYIFLLIFLLPLASADKVELGAEMIEAGNRMTLIGFANDIYSIGNGSSDSDTIIRMAAYTVDPYSIPAVQDAHTTSTDIFYCVFMSMIFIHAGVVILNRYKPEKLATMDFISVDYNGYHYSNYVSKMVKGIIALALVHLAIPFILDFEHYLTLSLMQDVPKSLEPTTENAVLYFMMSLIWLSQMLFFILRALVVTICVAFALLIVILYLIDISKNIAIGIGIYFFVMLFLQVIIVGVSCLGVRIIQESWIYLTPELYGVGLEFLSFFALMLLLFLISFIVVFSPILLLMLHRFVARRGF